MSFPVPVSYSALSLFSSSSFNVSGLTAKSLIHLWLVFVQVDSMGLISFFYMSASSFSRTVCFLCFWDLCQILSGWGCLYSSLGFQFCFIGLVSVVVPVTYCFLLRSCNILLVSFDGGMETIYI